MTEPSCIKMTSKAIAVLIASLFIITALGVAVSEDSDAATIEKATADAAGNALDTEYDDGRIMTVGVGTLRWVSYFGHASNVVCIDLGDGNNASRNGKAYRSLFDFDAASIIANASGGSITPLESDLESYGMAMHDHNTLSSSNLEALHQWENPPTLMIMSKSVYDELTTEIVEGITSMMDLVVIEEVDEFLGSDLSLSPGFMNNLSIMATALDAEDRANELTTTIDNIVSDITGLVDGKTSKFVDAYVGGASLSGSKDLTWTVASYLPMILAGVDNSYVSNTGTTAVDGGAEVMSQTTPSVIFMDLSGTSKFLSDTSDSVLTYAEMDGTPVYTILPYFWFGYNFDNALANAYYMIYVCYDGILTFDECLDKIYSIYEAFLPELSDGETAFDNMMSYYKTTGSGLTIDGQCLSVSTQDGSKTFTATDRPEGDAGTATSDNGGDDTTLYIIVAAVIIIVIAGIALMLHSRARP